MNKISFCAALLCSCCSAVLATPPPKDVPATIYVADAWEDSWSTDKDKAVFIHVSSSAMLVDGAAVDARELTQKVKKALGTKTNQKPNILFIVSGDVPYRQVADLAISLRAIGVSEIGICHK
jgi:biopolymer transport protein ExbD